MCVCVYACSSDRLGDDAHGLGVLVCEEREQRGEGAQPRREEDEERKLLLRVHRHLVERCSSQTHELQVKMAASDAPKGNVS